MLPNQWRDGVITPVPKVSRPQGVEAYRPITVTPILSRLLERIVVRDYIYPIFTNPDFTHKFSDQFAFRPTGSTTAALIAIWHKVTNLLQTHAYVHVIALDFSKAFDTVRHQTLIQKLALLPLPSRIHNWIIDYLGGRRQCTKYSAGFSQLRPINASIVQGSGVGPALYDVNSSDLRPSIVGNDLCKYADDTYLIVPPTNSESIQREIDEIAAWATANNLKLNASKTMEMVVQRPRVRKSPVDIPPPIQGIQRVESMVMLGCW